MFGLDDTVLGLIIVVAGLLMILDFILRDNEKNNPEKKQERLIAQIEKNKVIAAFFKKHDPNRELKKKPDKDSIIPAKKVARDFYKDPSLDIDELMKKYHLTEEPKEKVLNDMIMYLYKLEGKHLEKGDKQTILQNVIQFFQGLTIYIGLLFLMWGTSLLFFG